jgi:MFS family permease
VTGSGFTYIAVALLLRPAGAGWVSASLAAELLPVILGSGWAGSLVDRLPNRQLLTAALGTQGAAVAGVALFGLRPGAPWPVLAGLVVVGAGTAVTNPAIIALLPHLGGLDPTRTTASYAGIVQGGNLAGFALGGVVLQVGGGRGALVVDAVSYGLGAAAVALVRAQRRPERGGEPGPRSGRAGFAALWRDPVLRVSTTGFAAVTVFAVSVNVVGVFFVIDAGAGPAGFGLVTACWSIAGVVGARWARRRLTGDRALLAALAGGAVVLGAALLAAGSAPSLPVVAAAWLVGGGCNTVQRVGALSLIRRRSAEAEQGRAIAAAYAAFQAANLVSISAAGALVPLVGARTLILAAGAGTAVLGCAIAVLSPLRHAAGRHRAPAPRHRPAPPDARAAQLSARRAPRHRTGRGRHTARRQTHAG